MTTKRPPRIYDRSAQLRFSVVGRLLAAPPAKGTLQSELKQLSALPGFAVPRHTRGIHKQ